MRYLKLADVRKAHFEDDLKAYLIGQIFLPKGQQNTGHDMTRMARLELNARMPMFSDATRQLILRSQMFALIEMVVNMNREADILYLAEHGFAVAKLQFANKELFIKAIPYILNREEEIPYNLREMIVEQSSDIYELYTKSKRHKELFPRMLADPRCPPDLLVEIFNQKKTDPTISLGSGVMGRLEEMLASGKIYVVRKPSLIKEEPSEDRNVPKP